MRGSDVNLGLGGTCPVFKHCLVLAFCGPMLGVELGERESDKSGSRREPLWLHMLAFGWKNWKPEFLGLLQENIMIIRTFLKAKMRSNGPSERFRSRVMFYE